MRLLFLSLKPRSGSIRLDGPSNTNCALAWLHPLRAHRGPTTEIGGSIPSALLQIDEAKIVAHEADDPNAFVDFFDSEALAGKEYPSGVGRSAACLLNVPVLGLHGVEDTVGSERFDRFDEIEAAMEAEPFSGVAMPLDVEAVGADPVEASEGRVELLAEIFREAGAVALDEAILGAVPFAEDIDGIVELRRPD